MKKTDKKLIIILLIGFILFLTWFIFFREKEKPVVEKKVEISFEQKIEEFNEPFKEAFVAVENNDKEKAEQAVLESFRKWEEILHGFSEKQPREYRKTTGWETKLNKISDLIMQGQEKLKEGKIDEAFAVLQLIAQQLKDMRKENGIEYFSDDLLELYQPIRDIVAAKEKKEIADSLPDLKLKFINVKERSGEEEYIELMKKMEQIIGDLDKLLDGPDWQKAQSELKPLFLRLYLQYG